jgi:hypothetical protein
MASTAKLGGLLGLAALAGLAAATLVGGVGRPAIGALPVFVLVSLSLVVGLSTAASP